MRDILYNTRENYDFALAFCPTFEGLQALRECLPNGCVYPFYCASKVEELIKVSQKLISGGKARNMLLLLDDVVYDQTIFNSTTMKFIALNGRHVFVTCIILTQYLVSVPTYMRANIDYIITLRETVIANRKKLYNFFFGVFNTYEDFAATLDRCTQNFEALVLDNTQSSTKIEDCIFWHKATLELPSFKIGKKIFFTLSDRYKRDDALQSTEDTSLKGHKLSIIKEDDPEDCR
jgi:hypothetical protein